MSKVFHFSKYIYKSNSFCFPFLSLPCVTKCGLRIELLKSSRKARFSKEKKNTIIHDFYVFQNGIQNLHNFARISKYTNKMYNQLLINSVNNFIILRD